MEGSRGTRKASADVDAQTDFPITHVFYDHKAKKVSTTTYTIHMKSLTQTREGHPDRSIRVCMQYIHWQKKGLTDKDGMPEWWHKQHNTAKDKDGLPVEEAVA